MIGLSSGDPRAVWAAETPVGRGLGGAPVYGYRRQPGRPPIGVHRFDARDHPLSTPGALAHAHDFLVLAYIDRGGAELSVDRARWLVHAGDAVVVAPWEVVDVRWTGDVAVASAWAVSFPADVVDSVAGGGLSWRAHPLLFPFVGSRAGGVQRLRVPVAEQAGWSQRFTDLDSELAERREGFVDAAHALLTLLLVDLARLAADVVGHLSLGDEPLLAAVFDVIEQRHGEPISLRDVAAAVGMSPGHLTTVVGRRTGRTVQQWITERRMREARRLLDDPSLSVTTIAARVGYRDVGYFSRRFRADHGLTPQEWRRISRSTGQRRWASSTGSAHRLPERGDRAPGR